MSAAINENPFVGLRPFESDESLLFFGRQEQIMELLQRLYLHHFVGIVGGSGCGKSSLIRAGLIPRLKGGYLVNERDKWLIPVFKPGEAPLYNLADAFIRELQQDYSTEAVKELVQKIKEEGADAIIALLQTRLNENRTNVFILVDQFEELFRFSMETNDVLKKDEAIDFVNILLELARHAELPVFVTITMRSDFIGDCSQFYGLPEALNQSQYLVPRLTRAQLKNAIEGPVRLYGGKINPALTSRLLNAVQTVKDELPLLQHVLMRMWDNELQAGHKGELDLKDYYAVGGIEKALSNHADKALDGLNDKEKHLAEIMFRALTTTDHGGRKIRRPARLSELVNLAGATKDAVNNIISHFNADKRSFLVINTSNDAKDPLIDISHESLIRQWETLSSWVDDETESAKTYLRLSEAAVLNKNNNKDLIAGTELQAALLWQTFSKPNATWAGRYNDSFKETMAFLDNSKAQAENEKKKKEEQALKAQQADEEIKKQKEEANKQARETEIQKKNLKRTSLFLTVASVLALMAVGTSIWAIKQTDEAQKHLHEADSQKVVILNKIDTVRQEKAKAESATKVISDQFNDQSARLDTLNDAIAKMGDNNTRIKLLKILKNITANNQKLGSSLGLKQKYASLLNCDTTEIKNDSLYAFIDTWINTDLSRSKNYYTDCSSFIDFLLDSVYNKSLSTYWGSQLIYDNLSVVNGSVISSKSKLAEGDLVFFDLNATKDKPPKSINHIGLYLQNKWFIYYTTGGNNPGVKIKSIDDPYSWHDKFMGGVRFLKSKA